MKLYHRVYRNERVDTPPCGSLVVLHGLLGSGDNWHTMATRFSAYFDVYVPDMRNHGRSPHSSEFDYGLMAADILEFIDDHGLSTPNLLGHSMGGKVAMELTLTHPERVRKLVVEDMVPGRTTARYRKYVEALRNLDVARLSSRRQAEERIRSEVPDRLLVLFLLKNLYWTESGGFAWRANLDSLSRNYDNIWNELAGGRLSDVPVLFIRGGTSDVVTGQAEAKIQDYFSNAEVTGVLEAGHWVHSEAPELFYERVVDFLCP